jgi:hypothetical protein
LRSPCGNTVVFGAGGAVPGGAGGPGAMGIGAGVADIVYDAFGEAEESAGEEFPSEAM